MLTSLSLAVVALAALLYVVLDLRDRLAALSARVDRQGRRTDAVDEAQSRLNALVQLMRRDVDAEVESYAKVLLLKARVAELERRGPFITHDEYLQARRRDANELAGLQARCERLAREAHAGDDALAIRLGELRAELGKCFRPAPAPESHSPFAPACAGCGLPVAGFVAHPIKGKPYHAACCPVCPARAEKPGDLQTESYGGGIDPFA